MTQSSDHPYPPVFFNPSDYFPLFLLVILAFFFAGCAGNRTLTRPKSTKGPKVMEVAFEGNSSFKDKELLEAISLESSSPLLFWESKTLDLGELENDQERLLTYYRMQGFFEVDILPFRVVTHKFHLLPSGDSASDTRASTLAMDAPIPGPALDLSSSLAPDAKLELEPDIRLLPPSTAGEEDSHEAPLEFPTPEEERYTEADKRVRVLIEIREGPQYRVNEIRLALKERLPPALMAEVQHLLTLHEGGPFDLTKQQTDEAAIRARLIQASYAWAKVETRTVLLPHTKSARIIYKIDSGPPCTFASIRIEGLKTVSRELVESRARRLIKEGSPFDQALLQKLQRQLYDLKLFQSILVMPVRAEKDSSRVNITIRLEEKPFHQVKAGGGFNQDSDWQEVYVNSAWENNYLKNHLMRLSLFGQFGWAFSPNILAFTGSEASTDSTPDARHGPTTDVKLNYTLPDIKAQQISFNASVRFKVGQTQTYGYLSPQLRFNVSRPMEDHLVVQAGLGVEQYKPTPDDASQEVFSQSVATDSSSDIRFEGLLAFLEENAVYDRRDNVLSTSEGLYASLYLQQSGGMLSDFGFIKIQPEVRSYTPFFGGNMVLAGRFLSGAILPVGSKTAPAVLQFEAGGGSSIRGFTQDRITWYSGTDCTEAAPVSGTGDSGTCDVATGGNLIYEANLETRFYFGQFGAALFADAGQVELAYTDTLSEWLRYDPSSMNLSVGLGLRYRTLVGPIRLDLGMRLKDPLERGEPMTLFGHELCECALHLAIGEAF